MGRPTSYKPEFAEQARKLVLLGATDMQLADFFGVALSSISLWKTSQPKFSDALKVGKQEFDSQIERSLAQRALGFEHDAVKIFLAKDGTPVIVPYREYVVPDTTACIFWLKNRKPKEWRDKQDVEHAGSVKLVVSDL